MNAAGSTPACTPVNPSPNPGTPKGGASSPHAAIQPIRRYR